MALTNYYNLKEKKKTSHRDVIFNVLKCLDTRALLRPNVWTHGVYKKRKKWFSPSSDSIESVFNLAKSISGFQFLWFTDGIGLNSARHNLEVTFDVLITLRI